MHEYEMIETPINVNLHFTNTKKKFYNITLTSNNVIHKKGKKKDSNEKRKKKRKKTMRFRQSQSQ